LNQMTMSAFIRSHYRNTLIGCGGYTAETAVQSIQNKTLDLIAFGRPFIANPNLIHVLRNQGELQPYDNQMLDILF
jgi:N-ethylmaleimide reductase